VSTPALTICWCCDRLLEVDGAGAGDVAVCAWCGAIAVLGADLATAAPGVALLEALGSNEEWRTRYIALLRQSATTRRRDRGG
jgi:hypothetical protein